MVGEVELAVSPGLWRRIRVWPSSTRVRWDGRSARKTFADDEWVRQYLRTSGQSDLVQQHLATVVRLHRENRYDRSTDDVEQLIGHTPQTVEQYVASHTRNCLPKSPAVGDFRSVVVSCQPLLVDAGGAHDVFPQRYLAAKTISAPIREIHRCAIAAWIDCVPGNPPGGIEVSDTMSEPTSAVEQVEPVTPDAIMQLGLAFWGSKTLLSAVEMRLFAVLSEAGPLDAEELREQLGLHPRGARDFFDALVALGMLERNAGRYSNTPATELFLDPAKPSYMGGILEMANARLYQFWGSLTEGLRTGKPQSEAKTGGDFFESLYADPERLAQFAGAMSGLSTATGQAIAAKFPWRDHASVIDIGCAEGAVPVAIAQAHEHLTGGGFDLPPIEPIFDAHVARAGLADRLNFTPGDFFADPLPSADVLIMGHILHDWDLDQKRMLLQKAYAALPDGGRADRVRSDHRRRPPHERFWTSDESEHADRGAVGFDYTGADCRAWMADAGFSDSYVEHLVGPDSMVVGIK